LLAERLIKVDFWRLHCKTRPQLVAAHADSSNSQQVIHMKELKEVKHVESQNFFNHMSSPTQNNNHDSDGATYA
jgi:hypothetical protein